VATSTRDLDPWTSSSPTDLAVRASLPDWIVDALVKDHGWDRAVSLAVASQTRAPITLRANTLRATRESLLASLSAEGIPSIASEFSPWGVRLPGRHEVKNLVVFRSGLCDVQDEGSQLVALLTGVTPGMVVIDTCAGAGGKTLALSNMMENRGELVAFDSDKKKLDILRTRMRQAGAQIADAVLVPRSPEAFASDPRLTVWYERADVVLIDAPCSGSGTWRRNPDGPEHSTRESVLRSADLQRRLLTAYSRLLRPGGRLIYATCSLFREENQNVVEAWIAETPDFASIDAEIVFPQSLGPRICSDGYLQVAPDIHGTDGFFAAVMEKRK
jgi:16S rRNA (cytosine967-C5)-methyltransferase